MNNEINVMKKNAVEIKNISFGYKKSVKVIKNLTIFIPKGQIFGLLGENGCGKTTLLKLMLGRYTPDHGYIRVFGIDPQSKESDIPGPGVGFMPQEIALFNEFTINEMLIYFGTIYDLDSQEMKQRVQHLIQLLNLPKKETKISELSGGQQRLTSIAVTMIHSPKILILDEPTVGVDSLLRCRIWQYLEDICDTYGKTVIITTHYIEEAKRASNVGFMKNGFVLKQSNPQKLMFEYESQTLEEVYFKLWQQNDQMIAERRRSTKALIETQFEDNVNLYDRRRRLSKINYSKQLINFKRILALLWKFFIKTKRYPLFVILFNIIPVLAITAMEFTIGQLPYNIPVAVYNAESQPIISKQLLNSMNKRYIVLNEYQSYESAVDSVVKGRNALAITFDKDFGTNFKSRLRDPFIMADKELNSSLIKTYVDFSDTIIGLYVYYYFGETFMDFTKNLTKSLGYNPNSVSFPVSVKKPIYGFNPIVGKNIENIKTLSIFLTPAVLVVVFHLTAMTYSAFLIVWDRKEAHLERYFVAGGQPIEVIISHLIINFIIIIIQILLSFIFTFVVFESTQMGSYIEVYLICVSQALQGMAFGLFVSLLFSDEISVAILLAGLMFPVWIMSGVFWPLEAIPSYFRVLADWTPMTKPLDSLRGVMLRGWTYHIQNVWIGYVVSLSYTSLLMIGSILLFHTFSFNTLTLNNF